MSKISAAGKANYYERLLSEMQGTVFYAEDDEGVLRRWTPPKILRLDTEDVPDEAAIRADERAKVIAEAARSGCDWFKRESADGFEPEFYAGYVDCIDALHTPASRAITQATT